MSKKILIIDDDVDLVEVIRLTLENAGFEVIDAQSGKRGIELIKKEKPDLIILDVMMETYYAGFEVVNELRTLPEVSKTPVIMLTAINHETGYNYNISDDLLPVEEYLEKPIMPAKLLESIYKIILGSAIRQLADKKK